jgi:hypothetical protein
MMSHLLRFIRLIVSTASEAIIKHKLLITFINGTIKTMFKTWNTLPAISRLYVLMNQAILVKAA